VVLPNVVFPLVVYSAREGNLVAIGSRKPSGMRQGEHFVTRLVPPPPAYQRTHPACSKTSAEQPHYHLPLPEQLASQDWHAGGKSLSVWKRHVFTAVTVCVGEAGWRRIFSSKALELDEGWQTALSVGSAFPGMRRASPLRAVVRCR
jgi:hypothetical protein